MTWNSPIEGEMECFTDERYLVRMKLHHGSLGRIVHLIVNRLDTEPILGWDEMQAVKNKYLGEEINAIEIFPPESRLVNNVNARHLWALLDFDLPIGYQFRSIGIIDDSNLQRPHRLVR